MGVVGVHGEGERSWVAGLLAVETPEVGANVAALRQPAADGVGPRAYDDVHHGPRLATLEGGARRRGGIPDVADDARAERLRWARPDHVDLGGLIAGLLAPGVPRRQHQRLPLPFEDGRLLQPHAASQ